MDKHLRLTDAGLLSAPLPSCPGFGMEERTLASLWQAAAFKGCGDDLAAKLASLFDGQMPRVGKVLSAGEMRLIWAGPDQWWLTSESLSQEALAERLQPLIDPREATLLDLSHARSCLRLTGARRFDILNKSCFLDFLHFRPGDVAMTLVEQLAVSLVAVDEDTSDLYVTTSFAQALVDYFDHGSAEYR